MRKFKPSNKKLFKDYCENESFYVQTDVYYNKKDIESIIDKNFRNCDYIDCLLHNDYTIIKTLSNYELNDNIRFCIFNLDIKSTNNKELLEMIKMIKIHKDIFIHIVQFGDKNFRRNININNIIENFIENIFYKDTLSKSDSKKFAREYVYMILNRIDDEFFDDFFDKETNENIINEIKKIKNKYEEYNNYSISGSFLRRGLHNEEKEF